MIENNISQKSSYYEQIKIDKNLSLVSTKNGRV